MCVCVWLVIKITWYWLIRRFYVDPILILEQKVESIFFISRVIFSAVISFRLIKGLKAKTKAFCVTFAWRWRWRLQKWSYYTTTTTQFYWNIPMFIIGCYALDSFFIWLIPLLIKINNHDPFSSFKSAVY